jgi:predicted flap endonuclease-1-like 5' DNA nuclease
MQFKIKHGFRLKSADKVLLPGSIFTATTEEQAQEIRDTFVKPGAAEEIVSKPVEEPKVPEKTNVDPNDDITLAKGVGDGLAKKLAEKQITTFSGLKAAMTDAAREAEMKEVLGSSYTKVLANFVTPEA